MLNQSWRITKKHKIKWKWKWNVRKWIFFLNKSYVLKEEKAKTNYEKTNIKWDMIIIIIQE
jgi:hypothetical protein